MLQARSKEKVVANKELEELMLLYLTKGRFHKGEKSILNTLTYMDIADLTRLCKDQKKASYKDGKPVDYVRYSLYQIAMKKLAQKIFLKLDISELKKLENLVKDGNKAAAQKIVKELNPWIFRVVPELLNDQNWDLLSHAIAMDKNSRDFAFQQRQPLV